MALLALAIALAVPAIAFHLMHLDQGIPPAVCLLLFGGAIVAAAFVLTWAAELAQLDIGSGLAIVFIALVTVLPEYAVDMLLAWNGAIHPEDQHLALANMTGANRLLIGTGWPMVALIVWYRRQGTAVVLPRDRSADVVWLAIATLYSAIIPLKGTLAWYDAVILVIIYVLYVRHSKNDPEETHELVGPPYVMAQWTKPRRRFASISLFVWSAFAILMCAHPFVEALKETGTSLGIDRQFMIQWIAPLASESPEFVVVVLLTLRGRADMGFGAFVSSKVNQWTLLVGGVPIAFGLSSLVNHGEFATGMALDGRQLEELWLTITQGLYATAAITGLRFSLPQAIVILVLFLVQLVGSIVLESSGHHAAIAPFHNGLSILYVLLAAERAFAHRRDLRERLRDVFRPGNE